MTGDDLVGRAGSKERIDRALSRLEVLDRVRIFAFPVAAIAAGVSAAVAPIAFPIAAGAAAVLVGAGEVFTRKKRRELKQDLEDLKNQGGPDIQKTLTSTNRFMVGGAG